MNNSTETMPPIESSPSSRLNDRGEEVYDGTREYECLARACEEYDDVHTLEWGESMFHRASIAEGDQWNVAVAWNLSEPQWSVYGECRQYKGPLVKETTDEFAGAMERAYKWADTLNAIDAAGDQDLKDWARRALDATLYEASDYDHGIRAIVWLGHRPEMALESVASLFTAIAAVKAAK